MQARPMVKLSLGIGYLSSFVEATAMLRQGIHGTERECGWRCV